MTSEKVFGQRDGFFNVAVFKHTDPEKRDLRYSLSLQKSLRDLQGNWTNYNISFNPGEADTLIRLIQSAKAAVIKLNTV